MLFPYKYVPHKMEKMQEFVDYIFLDVWCKSPGSGLFKLDLFDGNADLKDVMTLFCYGDTVDGNFFYTHIESIYGYFAALTTTQIEQFKRWYQANNDIENVCANDPHVHIARYADIAINHKDLSEQLAKFFKHLYSHLDNATLKRKVGHIDEHYDGFMGANKPAKCPFCGFNDMLTEYHTKREAYDHYLPENLYPFNSINFRNLVPACHHCNSSYKTINDPAFTPKDPTKAVTRRKAFYPYTNHAYSIDIKINLKNTDVDKLTSDDIEIEYGPASLSEEIETWKDVYGIEERYKLKCRSPDAKDWLEQVRILKDLGVNPNIGLDMFKKQTTNDRFANSNFFKIAFLEGCDRAGLFTEV